MKTEIEKANELIIELVDHLEYCGWGDSWERECSEELQKKASRYIDALDNDKKLKKYKKNS